MFSLGSRLPSQTFPLERVLQPHRRRHRGRLRVVLQTVSRRGPLSLSCPPREPRRFQPLWPLGAQASSSMPPSVWAGGGIPSPASGPGVHVLAETQGEHWLHLIGFPFSVDRPTRETCCLMSCCGGRDTFSMFLLLMTGWGCSFVRGESSRPFLPHVVARVAGLLSRVWPPGPSGPHGLSVPASLSVKQFSILLYLLYWFELKACIFSVSPGITTGVLN